MQQALSQWLRDPEPYESLPAFYQEKRDHFRAGLAASRFRLLPCPGTYFQLVDYSAISDASEADFARRLTTDHGVAAIPTSAFYDRPLDRQTVRFCFAKREETLDRALERLMKL
jgi:methionine aminotransferase